jgi:hypothetical protein
MRVALAALLGTAALFGPGEHVFAQVVTDAVAVPAAGMAAPNAVAFPAPAEGARAVVVQNGGASSLLVLPAAGADALALPGGSAVTAGDDPPLSDPFTTDTPVDTGLRWDVGPATTSNVLTSDSPPLDSVYGPGAAFPNSPWTSPAG